VGRLVAALRLTQRTGLGPLPLSEGVQARRFGSTCSAAAADAARIAISSIPRTQADGFVVVGTEMRAVDSCPWRITGCIEWLVCVVTEPAWVWQP
jgi:hypothetical protein